MFTIILPTLAMITDIFYVKKKFWDIIVGNCQKTYSIIFVVIFIEKTFNFNLIILIKLKKKILAKKFS